MTNPRIRMLLEPKAYIGPTDVRKATQAAVYLADEVWIPSAPVFQPELTAAAKRGLARRIIELHELGAVKLWEIEGSPGAGVSLAQADVTLSLDVYRGLLEEVDDQLIRQRTQFLGDPRTPYDGITEIVLGKGTLWRFAMARALAMHRLLLNSESEGSIRRYFADLTRYDKLESRVIAELKQRLSLPDVSLLSIDTLDRIRQHTPAFRDRLLSETAGEFDQLFVDATVARVADRFVADIVELAGHDSASARVLGFDLPSHLLKDVVWDILQLLLPLLGLRHAVTILEWLADRKTEAPLMLLVELKRAVQSPH